MADDDADIVRFVEVNLRLEGFQVLTARDGQEALTKALDLQPDVVLLDVLMPRIDGYTVCARLRADQRGAAIPVILLTANFITADQEVARRAGADDETGRQLPVGDDLPRPALAAGQPPEPDRRRFGDFGSRSAYMKFVRELDRPADAGNVFATALPVLPGTPAPATLAWGAASGISSAVESRGSRHSGDSAMVHSY